MQRRHPGRSHAAFALVRGTLGAGVLFWIVSAVAAVILASSIGIAEETGRGASDAPVDAGRATEAELEVLRKLLGLPPGEPASAAAPADSPAEDEPRPVAATPEPPKPKAAATRSAPKKIAKPEPKRSLRPAPVAKHTSTSSSTSSTVASPTTTGEPEQPAVPASREAAVDGTDIPPAGTIVSAKNVDRWKHLLGPSMQWSVERGATLEVVDTKPLPLEPARVEATKRYSAQVELAADKRSMRNYVAGIPFPLVDGSDPDAGPKMMFNMEHRIVQDDLDARNFRCDTGTIDPRTGFEIQRSYLIDHFRRLYSVGRLWVDPKPVMPDPEGARYREMLYPIREPFDLKGAGFTYIRYLDPNRQDDSWLYFPQLKRVRRLSTAQRSEGIFGQDVDLDSYGGFAGNPAWTTWTYLGKKTLLTSMHASATTDKFEPKPADFFPKDVWEPREVHVILGISQLGGYNFGRRIIYLDAENWIVPYTEIYDLSGQLWRSLIHTWNAADRPRPNAKRAVYDYETIFINSFTLVDMQLEHATRCQFPSPDMPDEDGWYYVFGDSEGTTRDEFSVTNFVGTGH